MSTDRKSRRFSLRSSRTEPMQPTGATDEDEVEAARVANKFDIRRLIGGIARVLVDPAVSLSVLLK